MTDNGGDHSIVRYSNGGSGWAEFECGSCVIDIDMMDFDQADVVQAAVSGGTFECPNCHALLPVQDRTVKETSE